MKKHAIIPIFIPHKGCPNDCVFCNQKKITARLDSPTGDEIRATIEQYLPTLSDRGLETVEIAFFGGSFTGIPIAQQSEYLSIAKEYKDRGLIDKIHLSTRPDYIDCTILDNLKHYGVDIIELGVQSFDDEVLRLSNRGHNAKIVFESSALIKAYGFTLGIQLMIGLPGDTMEKALASAGEAVKIGPEIARLYPTVIINDTELFQMYKRGEYNPLQPDEAVEITKEMYKILDSAGINIIRVGLKSTDIINENGEISGNTYHPAFRQLVESRIAREMLQKQMDFLFPEIRDTECIGKKTENCPSVLFSSSSRSFSNLIGYAGSNKQYFTESYPQLNISFFSDDTIKDGLYKAEKK